MLGAVLLDLDDTLFDRSAAVQAWARARRGRELDPVEWQTWLSFDHRGRGSRRARAAGAARLGLAVDPDRFPLELAEHAAAEPGARAAIARLAAAVPVAIVTNGGAAQRVKLRRIGLDDVVHAVFVSSELGTAKPDVAIFDRALRWTGRPAGDVLFVGDDPVVDLAPAAAIGMATAWRRRGAARWPRGLGAPDHVIERIADLEPICAVAPPRAATSGPA